MSPAALAAVRPNSLSWIAAMVPPIDSHCAPGSARGSPHHAEREEDQPALELRDGCGGRQDRRDDLEVLVELRGIDRGERVHRLEEGFEANLRVSGLVLTVSRTALFFAL